MADNELEHEDPIKAAAEAADEPATGDGASGEVSPDVGMEALKIQLANEQAARADAERRAHAAQNFALASNADKQDSDLNLVISAIETIKRENMMNQHAQAEAMTAGDYARVAALNNEMSMNNAKLLQLDGGRVALEARAREARNPPPPPPLPSDPVEAVASQLSPRSASWIRAHPEAVKNQKTYTKMISLHSIAVADGIIADSDEYFDYIETNLGYRRARQIEDQFDDPQKMAAKPMVRKLAPPAAPPSRGASTNRMNLSAAQREAAAISGLTEEEYARYVIAEKKRGAN